MAGRRCLGVAKVERLKAGVREVEAACVGDSSPGSEKRTLFDLLVAGVLVPSTESGAERGLTGDDRTLLRRLGFRNAMGISSVAEDILLSTADIADAKLVFAVKRRRVWL